MVIRIPALGLRCGYRGFYPGDDYPCGIPVQENQDLKKGFLFDLNSWAIVLFTRRMCSWKKENALSSFLP
jgi:hypothetical protein